jgi:hypothetical protein
MDFLSSSNRWIFVALSMSVSNLYIFHVFQKDCKAATLCASGSAAYVIVRFCPIEKVSIKRYY